ncbi:MAG: EAL domain-containing protein [Sedimenticola sp.]|nr:EAL domain-containing protein [Sedimenticola sp.]
MGNAPTTVLLIEDTICNASSIHEGLAGGTERLFSLERVTCLADALERLGKPGIDVVMLDLELPDGEGIEVFEQVNKIAPNALILILSRADDEALALQAVERGAHDYLIKGQIDSQWLSRSLRYLIECSTARRALLNSEARFRAISDASPLGIFVSNAAGGCVYTNAAYQSISGLSFEQTLGTRWSKAVHPDDRQRVFEDWRTAAQAGVPFHTEFRFQREDGSVVWTRVNSAAISNGRAPQGYVQTVEDITIRKTTENKLEVAQEALFVEKERAQVTLNSIGDAVLTTDLKGNVTYLNLAGETMTGWSQEEALGRPLSEVFRIIDGTTRQPAENPARHALEEDRTVGLAANCVLIRRDGIESAIEDSAAPIHNRDGQVTGAVIVFHDVSQSRTMTTKMTHLAQHDFLTGLPNRALLTERLAQTIGLASRHNKQVALLFLDLDNFKHVNDALGHAVGDKLLQSVAERLVASVRSTDTVCRQGGDEFVILLAEIERPQDAGHIAEILLIAFSSPHNIDGHELHTTLSIGISIYPDDGREVESVMQNADTAMLHAKKNGRNSYQYFESEMNVQAIHRQDMERNLRRALKEREFLLQFQPKIELVSGAMVGAEVFIRWRDPDHGVLYPEQFVAIAEECGLIVPMGNWVLHEACRQVRVWLEAGLQPVPLAVNISAAEFRCKDFLAGVATILQETGLDPAYLELELTESALMHDADVTISLLGALKEMGVRLAIDDFGTGYSSLSYLQRFPIDTLKIDQSFVRDIATDRNDATIVTAVIAMGKNLDLRVIAEGVETRDQLMFIKDQHCDEGQGYYFSRSLSADEFGKLLKDDMHN